MDLSKLTPAPWEADDDGPGIHAIKGGCVCHIQCHGNMNTIARTGEEFSHADQDFIVLARNAFDVMMRHPSWKLMACLDGEYRSYWHVEDDLENRLGCGGYDPFTALVEADKWYKENVEKQA